MSEEGRISDEEFMNAVIHRLVDDSWEYVGLLCRRDSWWCCSWSAWYVVGGLCR